MRSVFLLFFVLFTATASYGAEVVGMALPLDGRLTPIGDSLRMGARAAARDLNAAGRDVRVIFANDPCKSLQNQTVSAALVEVEIIVGVTCFQTASHLADTFKRPVIALDTRNGGLDRKRQVEQLPLFEVSPDPDAEAQAIVEQIFPRFGDRPFALIDDGSVYGRGLSDALLVLGEQAGFKPVVVDNFRPLQTTQTALLKRLERSGVEAIFIAGGADDLITIARDMTKLKLDWIVGTGDRAEAIEYTPGFLDVPIGWLTLRRSLPQLSIELVEKLYEAPLLEMAAKGYAMIQVASQIDGTPEGATFKTILGALTFNEGGRAALGGYQVQRWDGRRFVPIASN